MNASLDALEFARLKALLARYVSTEDGKALLLALTPSTNLAELESEHALVAEAMDYLRVQRVPFREVPLLTPALEKLQVAGSRLDIEEIEAVQVFLGQIEGLRVRWKDEAEAFPNLAKKAGRLPDLRDLAKRLGQAVHDGQVDDRYSPELARIRRALETTRSRLTQKLEAMLRSPEYASQLQEQLVTVRNGRFVIPVRADQKRGVDALRVGVGERAQFLRKIHERVLQRPRLAHHIADLVLHVHALRERAEIQADHGAGQPVLRAGDDCLAGTAVDHVLSCQIRGAHAASIRSAVTRGAVRIGPHPGP